MQKQYCVSGHQQMKNQIQTTRKEIATSKVNVRGPISVNTLSTTVDIINEDPKTVDGIFSDVIRDGFQNFATPRTVRTILVVPINRSTRPMYCPKSDNYRTERYRDEWGSNYQEMIDVVS